MVRPRTNCPPLPDFLFGRGRQSAVSRRLAPSGCAGFRQPIAREMRFLPDAMETLIWAAVFLMLTVACATIGAAVLIGFPIAGAVPFVLPFA